MRPRNSDHDEWERYVEWTSGTLADVRNGVATWQRWPGGSAGDYCDTLRRLVFRGVASGSDFVVTWDEGVRSWSGRGVLAGTGVVGQSYGRTRAGVKADGVTDDTAALQAAVDAMIADPLQGKRLMLPSGSIRLTSAIVIPTSQGGSSRAHPAGRPALFNRRRTPRPPVHREPDEQLPNLGHSFRVRERAIVAEHVRRRDPV